MTDLERARAMLDADPALTCAFVADGRTFGRRDRGVKPLLDLLDGGVRLAGGAAADRVVGRAAAFCYVLLGVASVYACVVSEPALSVFRAHGISCSYGCRTERIVNRAGDGLCPMESAVMETEDAETAVEAVRKTLAALRESAPAGQRG